MEGAMCTDRPAVSIQRVSKSFGRREAAVRVLDEVSVAIARNEFFTLLGPSGCGKTTLLRLIAGFEEADEGIIMLDGADITKLPPFRRPVNTVFQSYALFPHLTVLQNVSFGLEAMSIPAAMVAARAGEALEMVQMSAFAGRRPAELSGGQQQRVALARALAPRPKVLLLDEPLSALDFKLRKEMQIELKMLQEESGITFIFVTHDQEEALTLSDRIAVMQSGHILQLDTPAEIYERPAHRFVADFIGDINLLAGTVENGAVRLACGVVIGGLDLAGLTPGAGVDLAIRPERTGLLRDASGAVSAELVHSAYLGTAVLHQLRLADGTHVLIRETTGEGMKPPPPGARLSLNLPTSAIQVFSR